MRSDADRRERRQRERERGAALTEFAIVVPLFSAMVFGSMVLTELGVFKLKTQEIARFGAWSFTQHPLSSYEGDEFDHQEKFVAARNAVADEMAEVYSDLDGARARLLPAPGAWGMTALALYEPPAAGRDFRNETVQLVPTWAQGDWSNPLSAVGMLLGMLGVGTGTESFAGGPFRRLHFNHQGQVSARATVRLVLPVDVERMRRTVALAGVGRPRGADLRRWLPAGRPIRDEDNQPIEVVLVADPWKIHEGFSVHPRHASGYANMVGEVSDNGLTALPGGQLLGWLTGLGQSLKKIPVGVSTILGFTPSVPGAHLFSRPYVHRRGERPTYSGTIQPGQVNIFAYTGHDEPQEESAVTNFESGPLYLDPRSPGDSEYLESLNRRGPNFMGCRTPETRGCWE
jgi:hypothetical protein